MDLDKPVIRELPEPIKCDVCKIRWPEKGYQMQMCAGCREKLLHPPIPMSIRGAAGVIALLALVAFTQFPAALSAGVAFERGRNAEKEGKYQDAEGYYRRTLSLFPRSTLALARTGIAAYHAGDMETALEDLQKVAGREVSKELADEVNSIIQEIDTQVEEYERSQKGQRGAPANAGGQNR